MKKLPATKANKTDAGNGLYGICRVIDGYQRPPALPFGLPSASYVAPLHSRWPLADPYRMATNSNARLNRENPMWPFSKKPVLPKPADVVQGDDVAQFSMTLHQWEFEIDGTEFTLSGRTFYPQAFSWARTVLADMRRLQPEIDQRVLEVLDGWPCDVAARELLSVSLDDYASAGQSDLAFVGDDSWGDFGVNVILAGGKIVDAYGGD